MVTPKVNFFIHSVPCLDGLSLSNKLVKKYRKEREFYSCNNNYNFVSYVNDGSKKKLDFIEYSGNNEKSTGIFDINGICSPARINEIRAGFKATKSPIWHGLISFEEMFGKQNCNSFERAFALMKTEFPRFLKDAKFDTKNIVWYAGFHTNTDHRHIHFSFYEIKPTRYRSNSKGLQYSYGPVGLYAIQRAKINIETNLSQFDNKIAIGRKELTETFKKDIKKVEINKNYYEKFEELIPLLPTSGRLSYASENMVFLKHKIDYLVDNIVVNNPNTKAVFLSYLSVLGEKDKAVKEMCKLSKINPDKVVLYEKYKNDLYRRLGNVVINTLLELKITNKKLEFDTKSRLAQKRIKRNKLNNSIKYSLYLSEQIQKEASKCFEEHMHSLQEMRLKVLIEQGVIEL